MQTFLRGRDLIGDLDFSKDEVETVLDVLGLAEVEAILLELFLELGEQRHLRRRDVGDRAIELCESV